jgi:YHS domain-containing protein
MNTKILKTGKMFAVASILLVGLVMLNGCKKDEPTTAQQMQGHEGHEHQKAEQESVKAAAASIEQKTCPVMGAPINKALFVEYKGKKVYFCCPGCEDKFKAEPEKYIAKLPQFQQQPQ